MHRRQPRGSALLISFVVVLVVTIISVQMIRLSARELAGATSAKQTQALVACAEAGRVLLLNRFRAVGLAPTSIAALNMPLDKDEGGAVAAVGGHADQAVSAVQVDQVKILPPGTFNVNRGRATADLSNVIGALGNIGEGTPYRVLVHCVDHGESDGTGGRQLEVEFGLQFGL